VEQAGVRSLGGEDLSPEPFRGRWSLVYAGAGDCAPACAAALVNMRQSWLALGKDARRVQRWFLVSDGKLPASGLLEEHPGLAVITPTLTSSGTLGAALGVARDSLPVGETAAGGTIWMMDPGGFVILAYGPSASATDILRDMQRLLKYSAQDR
jgi:cytochrome oxidase Cu insertion factor (SCO1/SenC/PrrC family)